MRILCEVGHTQYPEIYEWWWKVFTTCGHQVTVWDRSAKPTFDAFDEANPDLFVSGRWPDRAVTKCVQSRPRLRVVDRSDPEPAFGGSWEEQGVYRPELACDVAYVGNYSEAKAPWLYAIVNRFKTKVFGRTTWPMPQYLGPISRHRLSDVYVSAKVCINLSLTPRPQERVYHIMGVGGLCVSNLTTLEPGDVSMGLDSVSDFIAVVGRHLEMGDRDRRRIIRQHQKTVLNHHTYWHRCHQILLDAGFEREADSLMEIKDKSNAAIAV